MTTARCVRVREAEALRDRRLTPTQAEFFIRHMRECEACRVEHEALDALGRNLRLLGPELDEESVAQLRRRTLHHAESLFLAAREPRPRRDLGIWAALAVLLITSVAALMWPKRPDAVVVVPGNATRWRREHTPDAERIFLSSGSLWLAVRREETDPPLVVSVPDGEIEDLGTTFRVVVQDGKTAEIYVREGRVLFRRANEFPLEILAGVTWRRVDETAPEPSSPIAPAFPTTNADQSGVVTPPNVRQRLPSRPRASVSTLVQPAVDAASALERSEDDAYLQIIALLREGRKEEARLSARAYLRTFPNGFRRAEVQHVANGDDGRAAKPESQHGGEGSRPLAPINP